MKPPLELWRCPVCANRIGLYVPAHGRPYCTHTGTPRHAATGVAMVLVVPPEAEGVA
jgi:hypothetical protein